VENIIQEMSPKLTTGKLATEDRISRPEDGNDGKTFMLVMV
jgi:hypothetical protein